MMNFKSLSDSSTSESEDDVHKNMQKRPGIVNNMGVIKDKKSVITIESRNTPFRKVETSPVEKRATNTLKRKISGNDSADEVQPKFILPYSDFKRPSISHGYSGVFDDDSADEGSQKCQIPYGNFKRPTASSSNESELFDSEGEGQVMMKVSMPTWSNSSKPSSLSPESLLKSGIGNKMMEKMGYIAGKGLGKYGQGRTEIVEASKQHGRRGLGHHIQKLEPSDASWDFSQERESVEEDIFWMPECEEEPPDMSELSSWMKKGEVKQVIDDETNFCDPDVLNTVLTFKGVFDALASDEMRKARTRSNPFETIRGGIFLNRAAMKMANMDACFDFMFTKPKHKDGRPMVNPDELLYFADICAGPGGFSEYILWRKKWESKGFGFTLKAMNDFKLEEFFSGPPETFEPYYGERGLEGDGDIYVPANLEAFEQFVKTNTDGHGVHFVMADGGFSVEGRENIQEILSKRLYLCQFLCALMILRDGGHFVCKLFDTFTPFSVGLVYLMYRSFDKVCIHKPNTSRPANSERYIICKWKKPNTDDVCKYMFEINYFFAKNSDPKEDVNEVVPLDILKDDAQFFEYMLESNNRIGARQAIHLDKIRVFATNMELHDKQQSDFRKQCLEYWQVPDQARSAPSKTEPDTKFTKLMNMSVSKLLAEHELLTTDNLRKLENIFDYKAVVCGETTNLPMGFFLSLGRSNIYRLDTKLSKWSKVEVTLELPADTLFYGQLVHELKGEGKAQRKILCVHIIDAFFLGGKDVRKLHFEKRMALASKLAKAVAKPSRPEYASLKVKQICPLESIDEVLNNLVMKNVKSSTGVLRLCYEAEDGRHFIPSGLLIFNTIATPWVTAYSKSKKNIYYFNTKIKESATFVKSDSCAADSMSCFTKRFFWNWEKNVQLLPEQKCSGAKNTVHGETMYNFIVERLSALTGHNH